MKLFPPILLCVLCVLCGCKALDKKIVRQSRVDPHGTWLFDTNSRPECYSRSTPVTNRVVMFSRSLMSQAAVVLPPAPNTIYIGFTDAAGNWVNEEWTNVWTATALATSDLTAPIEEWEAFTPALETQQGVLVFPLDATEPQKFCQVMYQPRGAQ